MLLQDLVVPSFKPPSHYAASPLVGKPPRERNILAFFRGDMGQHRLEWYSRGGAATAPCLLVRVQGALWASQSARQARLQSALCPRPALSHRRITARC